MVANKVPGIRAALCRDPESAASSREHNDSNVLVLAANFTDTNLASKIVKTWLSSEFEGGRHEKRVEKIKEIENNNKIKD